MNTLEKICADKRDHVAFRKREQPLGVLEELAATADAPRGFIASLRASRPHASLIAEIKKASPSVGIIRADFDPASLARAYASAGAACLSVLTDTPYFQGHDEYLRTARAACNLPCLRKDFMVDPYQIVESRALDADCILIIMAALSDAQARELYDAAQRYNMDVLIEVHDADELDRALALKPAMIGVNSRNLKTLEVHLDTAISLAANIPGGTLKVAESGIRTNDDLVTLQKAGYGAFLVGESLMRQADLETAVRALLNT